MSRVNVLFICPVSFDLRGEVREKRENGWGKLNSTFGKHAFTVKILYLKLILE